MMQAPVTAQELMREFTEATGLDLAGPQQRYLWTDAFAVCNLLGFFRQSGDPGYRHLEIRLIDQVHHTLGRNREGDMRSGWISGLPENEGARLPAAGGLRIGKSLPERGPDEPYHEDRDWDRDGQYYHYLTRWMHALGQAGEVTGSPAYLRWAVALARTAHARFTYRSNSRILMYWKMRTDLSRPLVSSMGQHDPLDGLVTYAGLKLVSGGTQGYDLLGPEMEDMDSIVRHLPLATGDPLGVGGLLFNAHRIARLTIRGIPFYHGLLGSVASAALSGLGSFTRTRCLDLPAEYRLAFRELGLSAGLAAAEDLWAMVSGNTSLFGKERDLLSMVDAVGPFFPCGHGSSPSGSRMRIALPHHGPTTGTSTP